MAAGIGLTSPRDLRHWELFADWCRSLDLEPAPTTPEVIGRFLTAFPAPLSTQGGRVRAIRRRHESAGLTLELPTAPVPSALRVGEGWVPVHRALAQLPVYEHPKNFRLALRGRRDGWLVVLVGIRGLSRNRARTLGQSQVQLTPQIRIAGQPVAPEDSVTAAQCPACAVTRWLRVVGEASLGFRGEVIRLIRPDGIDPDAHDCARELDESWRQAGTLLPAIDRHGWVSPVPMSARSVSATMARRQILAPVAGLKTPTPVPAGGRFADATLGELAEVYDDVDRQAAALLLRIQKILDDSPELPDHSREASL